MIETVYSNPDFLEHHGVKGMHWGIRKKNYQATRDNRTGKQRAIDANKKDAENLRKHGYKKEADAVEKVGKKLTANRDKFNHPLAANMGDLTSKNRASELIDNAVNEPKRTREFNREHSRKNIYDTSKSLSDSDLKQVVSRMNLERQYRQLMNDDARDGRSYLENKLRNFGDKTVDKLLGMETNNISKAYRKARNF